MTEQAVIAALTEDSLKAALIEARSDIFVASQILGVTALRVHRAIAVSATLQATQLAIIERTKDDKFEKASAEAISAAVESRIALYRVAGLDSLYELATMGLSDNSAQNQVRLAAAARLAGPTEGVSTGGDIASALRELNEQYHREAPRIRVVRERISVEIEGHPDSSSDSRVIC